MNRPPVRVQSVLAREILDSRGIPTLEVEVCVETDGGHRFGRAAVPSGASTGEGEALELRDGDPKRYMGKGVLQAVRNVREKIAPVLSGREFAAPHFLDRLLLEMDGTPNKRALGANSILGVSMAFARAVAASRGISNFEYLAEVSEQDGVTLPVPLMNILNGGKHADNGLDIQEFMVVPAGFDRFSDALRAGVETFHALKAILKQRGLSTSVGDEGGFAPRIPGAASHQQVLDLLLQAIQSAGYKPGKQVFLALDCAASEFSEKSDDGTVTYRFEGKSLTSKEMVQLYQSWRETYPIASIEDGLSEHDWKGWTELTERIGRTTQLVGDDLFCTNAETVRVGIEKKAANAVLIKLNQIGTLTETLATMKLARDSRYRSIVSHRSGETEDTFIADLAVATDCGQIKTGSASRSDRLAKYNQLLRIEETLGGRARFRGKELFS